MSLLVVDQTRMVSDAYAVVTEAEGTRTLDDFVKVAVLPCPVLMDNGELTYDRVGFCGSAKVFALVLTQLVKATDFVASEDVVNLLHYHTRQVGESVLMVFPIIGGALTLHGCPDKDVAVCTDIGETLAYGSYYTAPIDGLLEYRAWFTVFEQALNDGYLPGRRYHVIEHRSSTVMRGELASRPTLLDRLFKRRTATV